MALFGRFFSSDTLEGMRRGQNLLGVLLHRMCRKRVSTERYAFSDFEGIWCVPENEQGHSVMLYLHGGGYVCGNASYARGVGSFFADKWGIRVFAPVYRLAPEHPHPAALTDAVTAYLYLLSAGYEAKNIVLCGESAGGGLLFSLCARLREEGHPLPAGIIAISPWTDHTMSGISYEGNRRHDPSMTGERLRFFSKYYTTDPANPEVSPLFLSYGAWMPPTLIFVGGHEIMLDDSRLLHEKLLAAGAKSTLVVGRGLWHGYLLYDLKECAADYRTAQAFLAEVLPRPRKLRWMRLDNAAKIYPAARSRRWSNAFRISATLKERVDKEVLQHALDVTARRFPSISVRLCRGFFWYYLEELSAAPAIKEEGGYPLMHMSRRELRRCAFRVLVYENRVAVEFFHAITDGNGGILFLKNLLAEYVEQKYGAAVPQTDGIVDRRALPRAEELADRFAEHCTGRALSRAESNAYHINGTPIRGGFTHDLTMTLSAAEVKARAKEMGVTVTAYLTAALMEATVLLQERQVKRPSRYRPVKVLLPVNLRRLFPEHADTLRNFAMYMTPEIDPRMGEYTLSEICRCVSHQMGMEITPKRMSARITANVNSEKSLFVRILPLFIKNAVMKLIFSLVGERKSSFNFSNLGVVTLPAEIEAHVAHMNFVLRVPATTKNNVSAISFGDELRIDFVRGMKEPLLERSFYEILRREGIAVTLESNAHNAPDGKENECTV